MPNRNTAPSIVPLSAPKLLTPEHFTLDNGTEAIYLHDPNQEVFKIDVIFEAGIYYQPSPLIAATTINMLGEGTLHHNAEEIAGIFDYYGAYIDFCCGLNKSEVSLLSLNKYAEPTVRMLAELLTESTIPEKELEIFLTNKRQEFLVNQEKTSYLARKKFAAVLFGANHPYANQIREQDYTATTLQQIRSFYQKYIHTRKCRLVLCGNINDSLLKLVNNAFSYTLASAPEEDFHTPIFQPEKAGHYPVYKAPAVQTSIRIGKTGVSLTDPDYAGFMLLNTILGGYFGSRLMSNIRENKGYTYGIQSFNVCMPQSSYWCITTEVNKEYTQATLQEVEKEIRRLQTEPVPSEELQLVKNFLHGDILREIDGVFVQADALKHNLNYGLDNRFYTTMIEQIKACTPAELKQLAQKYWQPEEMYVITAGE